MGRGLTRVHSIYGLLGLAVARRTRAPYARILRSRASLVALAAQAGLF